PVPPLVVAFEEDPHVGVAARGQEPAQAQRVLAELIGAVDDRGSVGRGQRDLPVVHVLPRMRLRPGEMSDPELPGGPGVDEADRPLPEEVGQAFHGDGLQPGVQDLRAEVAAERVAPGQAAGGRSSPSKASTKRSGGWAPATATRRSRTKKGTASTPNVRALASSAETSGVPRSLPRKEAASGRFRPASPATSASTRRSPTSRPSMKKARNSASTTASWAWFWSAHQIRRWASNVLGVL